MAHERVNICKCEDGFVWELWRRTGWNGGYLYYAVDRITGETLLGGCVSPDPDEIEQVMNLPR